jgi:NADPH2:quinone reductase
VARVVEVDLAANLDLDLAVVAANAVIVSYAATGQTRPALPVRELMTRNLVLRFVMLYTLPPEALRQATRDITAALANGVLTELPMHRYRLDDIAAAHDAVQGGVVGKVIIDL